MCFSNPSLKEPFPLFEQCTRRNQQTAMLVDDEAHKVLVDDGGVHIRLVAI